MRKIRLGVIGTGLAWERLHWPAMQKLQDKYEIVAVADTDLSRAQKAAQTIGLGQDRVYSDYRQMLRRDDMDAVDILVPIAQNFSVAEDVAKHQFDIICEKPLGANLQEFARHRELPQKYNVQILIAENYRYNEENNLIRDLVRQGRIGDVTYFIWNAISCFPCNMTQDSFAATEWRQHPDYPGGDFLDAALHDLAAMRHIFGAVDQVHALGRRQSQDFSPYLSYHVNIAFNSGVIGQFSYWPSGKDAQRPLLGTRIFGDSGVIYLEERSCGIVNIFNTDGTSQQLPYTPGQGYYNELLNFYNALTGSEQIAVTPEMEYGDAAMVFAILESLQTGQAVTVDTTPAYQGQATETPVRQTSLH